MFWFLICWGEFLKVCSTFTVGNYPRKLLMLADQLGGYLQQCLHFYLNPVMISSFIHFWWPGCPKIVWQFLGSASSCNLSLLNFYANACREI
jgi:hypothetical protein